MIAAGCNLWRNYDDIQCNFGSLSGIIDHWGDYGAVLKSVSGLGPYGGHWNDPGKRAVTERMGLQSMELPVVSWKKIYAPAISLAAGSRVFTMSLFSLARCTNNFLPSVFPRPLPLPVFVWLLPDMVGLFEDL